MLCSRTLDSDGLSASWSVFPSEGLLKDIKQLCSTLFSLSIPLLPEALANATRHEAFEHKPIKKPFRKQALYPLMLLFVWGATGLIRVRSIVDPAAICSERDCEFAARKHEFLKKSEAIA